jgi:selenocysteine lyase/cysteine desulfurase
LKAAVNYAADIGINNIWKRIVYLSQRLRNHLSSISGLTVRDIGSVKGGIVTFTIDGIKAEGIKKVLTENYINVSVSGQSSTLLDMKQRNLDEVVRASVHYYNTEEEIEKLTQIIKKNFS